MIKANELRVGNLIYNIKNEFEKRQIIVSGITPTMIACKQIVTEHKFFEPIPLTEEWFLKAGFDLIYYGYNGLIDIEIMLPWAGRKEIAYSVRINNEYSVGEPFQYVHQLQNLYFALTGEELVFSN